MDGQSLHALTTALVGVFFVALGIPLYRGRVPRNGLYGVRTEQTLADDETWYAINRRVGGGFVIGGVLVLLGTALLNANRATAEAAGWRIGAYVALPILSVTLILLDCRRALARRQGK